MLSILQPSTCAFPSFPGRISVDTRLPSKFTHSWTCVAISLASSASPAENPRRPYPGRIALGTRLFLRHGSGLYRFPPPLYVYPAIRFLRDPGQIQSRLYPPLLPSCRQSLGCQKRSDDCTGRTENLFGVPRRSSTDFVLRFREQKTLGLLNQQLPASTADHCPALSMSMAGGTLLQMDQTAFTDQGFLWDLGERHQNSNLDRDQHLCTGGDPEKGTEDKKKLERNPANYQHYHF